MYPGVCQCDEGWTDVDCSRGSHCKYTYEQCKLDDALYQYQVHASLHVLMEHAVLLLRLVFAVKAGEDLHVTKVTSNVYNTK